MMEKKNNKKIMIICGSILLALIVVAIIIFSMLSTIPGKNIGKWNSSTMGYSVELKLYEDKHFQLTFDMDYLVGTTYNANVTYKGTYKYFNGKITLIPDNENIEYKGNFGDNRLTIRKIENGSNGNFIEFKK